MRFVARLVEQASEAEAWRRQAKALAPLARPETWRDAKKLQAAIARARKKRIDGAAAERSGALRLLEQAESYARAAPERARREISRGIKRACAERGIELRVVRVEPPEEVRIPPVAVAFDFARGRAEVRFARHTLATCAARIDDVLATRDRVVAGLERGFEPDRFLQRCLRAYRLALADTGRADGDRVEILDFLPFLALTMQDERFAVEPSVKNYRPYGRARFAYDVWQLRRAGRLTVGDVRLNLGVATGTTGAQKKRSLYFEDGEGEGEMKLTLFFTKAPAHEVTA
jgi:hypothetical protein